MKAEAWKDEQILVLLAQLALIYWRPDFTPGQARQLHQMYLDDLRTYALADIREAVLAYRRDPQSKFFPTPGQLLGHIEIPSPWHVGTRGAWVGDRRRAGQAEIAKLEQSVASKLLAHGDAQ